MLDLCVFNEVDADEFDLVTYEYDICHRVAM